MKLNKPVSYKAAGALGGNDYILRNIPYWAIGSNSDSGLNQFGITNI